ncbi:MAG: DNA mismatch repair endonuclease MutL [Eubacterium sp.]
MGNIRVLDQGTINKIAAGEVIDRPASVVKELLENAIDAGSTNVSIEIKEGGISSIRITDNGCGFQKEDIKIAFLRHSTSKITSIEDLISVHSLGFRGEALSSIAAISQIELITKPHNSITGYRYVIEGGKECSMSEVGVPDGTTFIIRNLFFNTPARKKFLKSAQTEAGYISDIIEHICLSHPEVAINFINNGKCRIHTSGNSDLKDVVYNIYGRDIANNLIEINSDYNELNITGYIGKPIISKGNRSFENYYINGRYIKNKIITKAIEEAYSSFMMQHKYPFTALHFSIPGEMLDVNVHPSKMELRLKNGEQIYSAIIETIKEALTKREYIPHTSAEDFNGPDENDSYDNSSKSTLKSYEIKAAEPFETKRLAYENLIKEEPIPYKTDIPVETQQMTLEETNVISSTARPHHKLIGQVFDTYWIIEYENNMYIIDQHAAHEKVLFEKTMERLKNKDIISQQLNPPIILTLSLSEEELINKYMDNFNELGFEIDNFGGREYAVRAVPFDLYSLNSFDILTEMIGTLSDESPNVKSELITEKIASMSCKAAVKGNNILSAAEANALIDQLLMLENPYNCPHGRPTIISMSKYELEKKFKRVL